MRRKYDSEGRIMDENRRGRARNNKASKQVSSESAPLRYPQAILPRVESSEVISNTYQDSNQIAVYNDVSFQFI